MSVCVFCCLSHPACESHLFCAILLGTLWLYNISAHQIIKGTMLGEKLLNIKSVVWLPVQHLV